MTMTVTQGIITIVCVVLGTMVTRFLPFLIFPEGKEPPEFIRHLGNVLPYAVIGLLVVYCLKDVPHREAELTDCQKPLRFCLSSFCINGKRIRCLVSAEEPFYICCWCRWYFDAGSCILEPV